MVKSITTPKVAQHSNPIPNAAVHRGLLVTSGILGKELGEADYPADKARQFTLAFHYLETILEEAGATTQDVLKLDLYFADKADRPLANPHWLRLWPDPEQRPARQAHQSILPPGCAIQIVAMAVLDHGG
ncbi:MAG: RidA family protein [Pikeienuella sp.]